MMSSYLHDLFAKCRQDNTDPRVALAHTSWLATVSLSEIQFEVFVQRLLKAATVG